MPSAREIRVRMNSIQQTRKITNAMYLISSAKLRKAKQEWDQTRPYFQALKAEVKRIFRTSGHVESRYLYPDEGELPPDGTYGFLVITADKGLAGAYNQNVLKEAHRLMQEHPQTKLFVVGEYGRQYFQRHQVPIERSFLYTAQNPTVARARDISELIMDLYLNRQLDEVYVLFTKMVTSFQMEPTVQKLLPLDPDEFPEYEENRDKYNRDVTYVPSVKAVMDRLVAGYLKGELFGALVESYCSEQTARMTAMKSSSDSAREMLQDLNLSLNRARQAAITQEITEVVGGAQAAL